MKKTDTNKENLTKLHKNKLGMEIPEGFFERSKEEILNKVIYIEKSNQKIFWLKPMFAYPIAAALVLAIAITFLLQNNNSKINEQITDTEDLKFLNSDFAEADYLVTSLLVSDSDMDEFLDTYIMDEILVEVDKSEQEIDDLIINSLFIGDSLIDSYIDQNLLENVIL